MEPNPTEDLERALSNLADALFWLGEAIDELPHGSKKQREAVYAENHAARAMSRTKVALERIYND